MNLSDIGIYYLSGAPSIVTSLAIESLSTIYSNGTYKIFEFIVLNDGDATVTDIWWQFDAGNGDVINSTMNMTLTPNERAFVYIEYNYSAAGNYNIKANATGLSQSTIVTGSLSSESEITGLNITNFEVLNEDGTRVVFEIDAQNVLTDTLTGLNWSLDDGNGQTLNSNQNFTLAGNETIFIFVEHDYSNGGQFESTATVSNADYSDSSSINFEVKHLEAENLSVLNQTGTKIIFEFIMKNYLNTNITNASFSFDTKNSNVINSTIPIQLQPDEEIFIYLEEDFGVSGTFNVNATARNGTLTDSTNLTIVI